MASPSSSSSNPNVKICRKCQGTCPPCRPWRCKFGKGRTLEECEVDLQKSLSSLSLNHGKSVTNGLVEDPTKNCMSNVNAMQSSLSPRNHMERLNGIARSGEDSLQEKSNGFPPGIPQWNTSNNDAAWSTDMSKWNPASTPPATAQEPQQMPLYRQPLEHETSHIFLAIAADASLVNYSKTVLSHVIQMPEVPEITSINDSRCIWPHIVHLTIYSFGKILNIDIPNIIDYCKKNIEVIEPFHLNITGMFHHDKLHTIGYAVEKETVEPLRQIMTNMAKWFNRNMCWDSFIPVMSLLRTHARYGDKYSNVPVGTESINVILQNFGGVQYAQEVIPERDIQLCLAKSSTETTFYKNLLV